jgi:hypothetical protein
MESSKRPTHSCTTKPILEDAILTQTNDLFRATNELSEYWNQPPVSTSPCQSLSSPGVPSGLTKVLRPTNIRCRFLGG